MLSDICSNNELKQSLLAALGSGRLSHSVLIAGEIGTGTGYAARCLAADYLYPKGGAAADCVMRGEGAECITITGEGASGDIKIDTVRAMRREIFNTALSAGGRCVIIKNAGKLNASSANALLKVLEEPPENVLFILTAPSEAAVLPTISSRCAIYTIGPVSQELCKKFLMQKGTDELFAEELAKVFKGKIGMCMGVILNENEKMLFELSKKLYQAAVAKNELSAGALLAKYEKDKPSAVKLLTYTRAIFSDNLADGSQQAAVSSTAIYNALLQLSHNAAPKLVFTSLAAKMCG